MKLFKCGTALSRAAMPSLFKCRALVKCDIGDMSEGANQLKKSQRMLVRVAGEVMMMIVFLGWNRGAEAMRDGGST